VPGEGRDSPNGPARGRIVFRRGHDVEVLGIGHQFQVIEQQAAANTPVKIREKWREFVGENKGRRGGHGDSEGATHL
jgi:hypothetical protein